MITFQAVCILELGAVLGAAISKDVASETKQINFSPILL